MLKTIIAVLPLYCFTGHESIGIAFPKCVFLCKVSLTTMDESFYNSYLFSVQYGHVIWAHRSLLLSNPDSFHQQPRIAHNLPIAEVTSLSNNHLD